MKCVIPGTNCKILGKAIHAMAKIGEEMYVEPRDESLSFRCVSSSNSAYCDFTFRDTYFSSYTFGNLDANDALKCKISMRSVLSVFKSIPSMEKLVETCYIKLEPDADQLVFILKFKNGVLKTFFLPIIDCEQLNVPYVKDNAPNKFSAKCRILSDVVQNFQQNLVEITLEATPQKLLVRNYLDDKSVAANLTRTQLAVTVGEFDEYKIDQEAQVTFCLKELRAMLLFAEAVSLPLNIYFESAGQPVMFDLKSAAFEANLLLSTLNPDSCDVSVDTSGSHRVKQPVRKRAALSKKATGSLSGKNITKRKTSASLGSSNKATISNREDIRMEVDADQASTTQRTSNPPSGNLNDSTEPSIFSSSWRNKRPDRSEASFNGVPMDEGNDDDDDDNDEIPGSPTRPSKKAKIIFNKCYGSTFDPRMLPGHDAILADDSDDGS